MNKSILNNVKQRLLILSPTVRDGIERECTIKDFESIDDKPLGKGGFGQVWRVKCIHNQKVLAIKVISKQFVIEENMIDQMNREIDIMYKINHPYIIKLLNHFEDDESFYLIMELANNGQLYSLLKKKKRLDEQTVAQYMREVISALQYLHQLDPPIIHRDIKPENILLDHENKAKLADFGWSNFIEKNKTRETVAGTPEYLAPEMVMKSGHDAGVDIWSIGILIFELLVGRPPFVYTGDMNSLFSDIKHLKIKWSEDINPLVKDLISRILKFKSKDRISLEEILNHKWFKETPLQRPILQNSVDGKDKKVSYYLMTKKKEETKKIEITKDISLLTEELKQKNEEISLLKQEVENLKKVVKLYEEKDNNKIVKDFASLNNDLLFTKSKLELVMKENKTFKNEISEMNNKLKSMGINNK